MSILKEEGLKKIEPKEQQNGDLPKTQGVIAPDRKKIGGIIKLRKEKLEKIKLLIPLKTYNSLLEKLNQEEAQLDKKLVAREKQLEKDNQAQALPKVFFEQKFLKPKNIRIN